MTAVTGKCRKSDDPAVSPSTRARPTKCTWAPAARSRPPRKASSVSEDGTCADGVGICPIVASAKLLTPELAEKWQVDLAAARQNWLKLCAHELQPKLDALFKAPEREPISDPDLMIYSGGFFSGRDKAAMAKVRTTAPQDLPRTRFDFDDPRLPEMLFRYRARNYPETLSREERGSWDEYRNWRLTDPAGGASIVLDDYLAEIERLGAADEASDAEHQLLEQLMEYAEQVVPDGA